MSRLEGNQASDRVRPVTSVNPHAPSFDELNRHLVSAEGSDLHLRVGSPPLMRVPGRLEPVPGYDPLDEEAVNGMRRHILRDPTRLGKLQEEGALDFSFGIRGGGRMRANAFMQRDSIA